MLYFLKNIYIIDKQWGDFMIQKMFYALVASIALSFIWIGFIIYNAGKTEYKNEIERINVKESRTEENEEIFNYNELTDSNDGFILTPNNIKYDSIKKFYTASNSHLISKYNLDGEQIEIELSFKADGSWFLYYGSDNEIAYEGEYKLINKTIYAKVNKIYKSNQCYDKTYGIYEFNIITKNGKKVTNLMIGNNEFIEINKKLLTKTNTKFNNKDKIKLC